MPAKIRKTWKIGLTPSVSLSETFAASWKREQPAGVVFDASQNQKKHGKLD